MTGIPQKPNRSFLFAPGSHPRRMEKAMQVGADAVILDLEDAVAVAEKPSARTSVVDVLAQPRHARIYVRVNALDTAFAFGDLEAVVPLAPDGIVVPKVESAAQMETAAWTVAQLSAKAGLPDNQIDLMPILESGQGLASARAIASAVPQTRQLAFGAADYTMDMGMTWTRDESECLPARAEIVLASRIAGLDAPIDTVWAQLDDTDGLAASARRVRDMGFQGKMCIHPDQLTAIHNAFTPSAEQIAHATRVVAAFDAAEQSGSASIQVDGQFVDYPIVDKARRLLAIAETTRLR